MTANAMSTLAYLVEQAPMGMGYALYALTMNKDDEGKPQIGQAPVAFKTSLVEITEVRARLEKDAFGAEALPPQVERVHYLPAPQQHQPPPPQPQHYGPLEGRPKVLNDMDNPPPREPDPSLVERAKQAMGGRNSRANALAFTVFVTLAMAAHSMGLRA